MSNKIFVKHPDLMKRIEERFFIRMSYAGIKPGTAKYRHAMEEYFMGAMATLVSLAEVQPTEGMTTEERDRMIGESMPPRWVFGIMRGGFAVSEPAEEKK